MLYMKKKILFLFIIVAGLAQFACKKNVNGGGPPVITDVRSVDTTKRDSFFVQAVPGSLIVIQGNGFDGLQAVFFNDTSAYFNPSYVTNNNIIITIPATAKTAATNPGVPSTIKLVTDHGTVTYSFKLYLPPPFISSIAFDNSGTLLYINGSNFEGIQKITFPVPGADTALSYTVNSSFTQITAAIPPGTAFVDSLRVYCTFGESSFPYPPPMTISSVSNENAVAGTTITINGTNFIGVTKVTFPGGIAGTNVQNISVNQVNVTVPPGITAPDSLRLTGGLGTAAAPQLFDSYITHPSPGYLSTFDVQYTASNTDNTGFVGWTGGYASSPSSTYPNGTGGFAVLQNGAPMKGNTSPGSQGNAGFSQLYDVPWVANTATPVAGYSLKFEVYVAQPWTAGELWVMMGDWYGWHNYLARYAPWTTAQAGTFQPSGWVTVTIPLSQLILSTNSDTNEWDYGSFPTGSPATLFSNYTSTALCFTIVNDQASPTVPVNGLNIGIDNVRIVQGQ